MSLHIHAPPGEYRAQHKAPSCRKWTDVGKPRKTLEASLAGLCDLKKGHVRILFCDLSGWYEPHHRFEGRFR